MDILTKRSLEGASESFYRAAAVSGTIAAALGANSELFQWRFAGASKIAVVRRVSVTAGLNVAATAAALASLRMTAARSWTAAGSGGTRLDLSVNNAKLRTSYQSSLVNDAGIATTGALTAGTKTLDATDLGVVAFGILTGALTTVPIVQFVQRDFLFDGGAVFGNQEGFVIRTGAAMPAAMTWHLGVEVEWAEVSP